jgi:hypothetical protein
MDTRFLRTLVVGLVLGVVLGGCATTASRQDLGGLPTADHPEYLAHPLRMISLGMNFAGNIIQHGAVEPFYFVMARMPDMVGLSLEERRYLERREEAWRAFVKGERRLVE